MAKLWEVLDIVEADLIGTDEQTELRSLRLDLKHKE
jgi:hypothetical protein